MTWLVAVAHRPSWKLDAAARRAGGHSYAASASRGLFPAGAECWSRAVQRTGSSFRRHRRSAGGQRVEKSQPGEPPEIPVRRAEHPAMLDGKRRQMRVGDLGTGGLALSTLCRVRDKTDYAE